MKVLPKDNTRRLRLLPVCKQKGVRAWSRGWELNPPQSSIVVGCLLRVAASSPIICSPPPEPFGLRWKSLTKASPTPALRSLAPGNFDASTIALYKPSRKKSNSQLHSATGSFVQRIRSGHIGRFGTEGSRRISKGETAEGIHGSPNPDAPNRSESDS